MFLRACAAPPAPILLSLSRPPAPPSFFLSFFFLSPLSSLPFSFYCVHVSFIEVSYVADVDVALAFLQSALKGVDGDEEAVAVINLESILVKIKRGMVLEYRVWQQQLQACFDLLGR